MTGVDINVIDRTPDIPGPQQRRAATLLIATGLDLEATPPAPRLQMAADIAQALGLTPTVPACPAQRHGEPGTARTQRLAHQAAHRTPTGTQETPR